MVGTQENPMGRDKILEMKEGLSRTGVPRTWYNVTLLQLIAAYERKHAQLESCRKAYNLLAEANEDADFPDEEH